MFQADLGLYVVSILVSFGCALILGSYLESRLLYQRAKITCENLGYDWKKFRNMMKELMRG